MDVSEVPLFFSVCPPLGPASVPPSSTLHLHTQNLMMSAVRYFFLSMTKEGSSDMKQPETRLLQ